MSASLVRNKLRKPTNLVFTLVVVSAYISTFALTNRPFSTFEIALLLALGMIFLAVDLWGLEYLLRSYRKVGIWIYFGLQISVVGVVMYLSHGNAWLMVMPLTAQTVIDLSRRAMLFVNGLLMAVILVNFMLITSDWRMIVQSQVAFLTAMVFVAVFTQLFLREKKARSEIQRLADELGDANRKLREYAAQVEELAATSERNRLAREIHDGLGHYLTAINMQIRAAKAVMEHNRPQASDALEKAQTLSQDALEDIRHSVATLRGEPALNRPLVEMLEHLLEDSRAAGLVAGMSVAGTPRDLTPQVELTLFRATQEGLTNVRKHALASRVDLRLEFCPDSVRLAIHDNGVGIKTATGDALANAGGGFGLFGLRERVQLLGGVLNVGAAPERGYKLEIEIPG